MHELRGYDHMNIVLPVQNDREGGPGILSKGDFAVYRLMISHPIKMTHIDNATWTRDTAMLRESVKRRKGSVG